MKTTGGALMSFFLSLIQKPRALRALRDCYALLENVTPLKQNCGRLCGAACCQSDESGENGMLLFPYEEAFFQKPSEEFPFHLAPDDSLYKGGKRLVCEGKCPREARPLACRLFPLRVRLDTDEESGETRAIPEIDPRAWCCCPLPEMGLRALDGAFVEAVRQVGQRMIENVDLLEALYREQALLDDMRRLG